MKLLFYCGQLDTKVRHALPTRIALEDADLSSLLYQIRMLFIKAMLATMALIGLVQASTEPRIKAELTKAQIKARLANLREASMPR